MGSRDTGGERRRAVAAMLSAAIVMALPACGADDEPESSANGARKTARTFAPASTVPEDGRLTSSEGTVITNTGSFADRRGAVVALARLQDDFRSGRMVAACRRINDFLLSNFRPPGTGAETPCPRRLEAYAAARERRGSPPVRMRLLWVRHYTGETGIWVDDARGKRLRIQMSSARAGGDWRYDLGPINRPDVLAAELTGADRYLGR